MDTVRIRLVSPKLEPEILIYVEVIYENMSPGEKSKGWGRRTLPGRQAGQQGCTSDRFHHRHTSSVPGKPAGKWSP